jgi:hypothetical protein
MCTIKNLSIYTKPYSQQHVRLYKTDKNFSLNLNHWTWNLTLNLNHWTWNLTLNLTHWTWNLNLLCDIGYNVRMLCIGYSVRRDLHVIKLLYSTLFYPNSPLYLRNCFSFQYSSLNRYLRSSSSLALDIPPHSSDFMSYSFNVHAVRLWNPIPDDIRRACSLESFRNLVRGHWSSRL